MILVLLSYKVDAEAIAALRPEHRDWLAEGVAAGRVLAAGRKVPVTGGLFMARGTLDEIKAWAATDPFAAAGVADYEFLDIEVTMTAPGLEPLSQ